MSKSKLIRIGNDIVVRWTVKTNGADASLERRNIEVRLQDILGTKCNISWSVNGNVVNVNYQGKFQKRLGKYTLVLVDTTNGHMNTVDHCSAFELVPYSHLIGGTNPENVVTEVVELSSSLEMGGTYIDIVDNLDSDDTTKALSAKQGKVLDGKIKERASVSNIVSYQSEGSVMPYADTYIFQVFNGGIKYPVHWNSWLDTYDNTVHQSFCVAHERGKGTWYVDYLEKDDGLEFVATYDKTTVPRPVLIAVGEYIDTTLNISGVAADARVVGDSLAQKADYVDLDNFKDGSIIHPYTYGQTYGATFLGIKWVSDSSKYMFGICDLISFNNGDYYCCITMTNQGPKIASWMDAKERKVYLPDGKTESEYEFDEELIRIAYPWRIVEE